MNLHLHQKCRRSKWSARKAAFRTNQIVKIANCNALTFKRGTHSPDSGGAAFSGFVLACLFWFDPDLSKTIRLESSDGYGRQTLYIGNLFGDVIVVMP
jgi:hypothetical protein